MKNFYKVLGIIVMAAVIVFSAASCKDSGGGGGSSGGAKSITITGLPPGMLYIDIEIFTSDNDFIAYGEKEFSGTSVTLDLLDEDDKPWTGSGSYHIELELENDEDDYDYLYTGGKKFTELGINVDDFEEEDIAKLPKYNFSSANSTIPFTQFKQYD
jgi:hypothetical protein